MRRPYPCGVVGTTVGVCPRGTGSNPVEGNGHFFPSYRRLYLSSFSDTRAYTLKKKKKKKKEEKIINSEELQIG